ncbi:hypothetical protein OS493_013241 [Desmophyllum pertusum]|uniref:Uncharacterized protein n=1 Tax=Desmophyllum pertusum TaxID=174260 RepID=A0A9W9YQ42_9CNID|nr:hypothetical protein OS493_013241 [Desmophyllum pertusum]
MAFPHRRSRMCVLNNPVVSGSRKRPERPKSAPPTLRAYEFDAFMENIEDDRLSCVTLPNFHHGFPESTRSTDDLSSRLKDLIVDAPPAPEYINDDSSFGYDPSDDMSESSSAFYHDQSNRKRDPAKFNYSRPKLLRLSADFPGVRIWKKCAESVKAWVRHQRVPHLLLLNLHPGNTDFSLRSHQRIKLQSKGMADTIP